MNWKVGLNVPKNIIKAATVIVQKRSSTAQGTGIGFNTVLRFYLPKLRKVAFPHQTDP